MNSILLSGLQSNSLSALDANTGTKTAGGSSFAQLLQHQADDLDVDMLQWLQSLDLDALFAELKSAGLDPKVAFQQLKTLADQQAHPIDTNTLISWLKDAKTGPSLAQRLQQLGLNTAQDQQALQASNQQDLADNQDALAFVQSTLFIAQESASLRQGHAATLTNEPKNLAFSTQNEPGFNLGHLKAQLQHPTDTSSNPRFENLESGRFAAVSAVAPSLNSSDTQIHFGSVNLATTPNAHQGLQAAPNFSAQIPTPVTHSQWSTDLGRVMVSLTQQAQQLGPQNAEIRLDPPQLGPLRIVLSVVDNVAHATIYAAHAQTRLTVEHALPQLQQQLAQSGLSLGDANVSDQGFAGQSNAEQNSQHAANTTTFSLQGEAQSVEHGPLVESNSDAKPLAPDAIIDTFA